MELDPLGNKLWDKSYGGNGWDELAEFYQTANGDFILGGFSASGNTGDKGQASKGGMDFWVIRINSSGIKIWDNSFGGAQDDRLYSMRLTPDGGYVLAGPSNSGISGDKSEVSRGMDDFWIVKLGPDVLGTKEPFEPGINIFPNPTNGIINLKLSHKKAYQVSVFNTLGQIVLIRNITGGPNEQQVQIDLAREAKGLYTIQILSENQKLTRKVVLQ